RGVVGAHGHRRSTGLRKASVANVYDVQKVLRSDCMAAAGVLAGEDLSALGQGLRLVLDR
ncbi:MAG TPA: hypothetical protein VNB06_20605, partial [Thermoanaerobaculia bacterium]|nr:hypothetical protein [Thermoanaerobaculia bacterium]